MIGQMRFVSAIALCCSGEIDCALLLFCALRVYVGKGSEGDLADSSEYRRIAVTPRVCGV